MVRVGIDDSGVVGCGGDGGIAIAVVAVCECVGGVGMTSDVVMHTRYSTVDDTGGGAGIMARAMCWYCGRQYARYRRCCVCGHACYSDWCCAVVVDVAGCGCRGHESHFR